MEQNAQRKARESQLASCSILLHNFRSLSHSLMFSHNNKLSSKNVKQWSDFFTGVPYQLKAFDSNDGCQFAPILPLIYLLTYMGVFDLAFVSSVLPQLPADCNKWGLLWKPSVTGSYWYPFLHVRLPPAIYLFTNLYGSLWFGHCLQCSPTAPSRLQKMGPPMKALCHKIVLIHV